MGDYGKEASESCSQHCVALDDDAQYTTKYNYDPRHRIRGLKSFLSRYIALFVPYPLIVKKIWILSGSATLFFCLATLEWPIRTQFALVWPFFENICLNITKNAPE